MLILKKKISILRYDNSPHHKDLKSFPHHKHIKDSINVLESPSLKEFVRELKELSK